jgi:hypothetical protein
VPRSIPPFRLAAIPLTEEAAQLEPFKWADAEVGKRHKLGGAPDFLDKAEFPTCPSCGKSMSFYGQLDSLNDEFVLADCGMVYVFVCFDCFETKAILQSY